MVDWPRGAEDELVQWENNLRRRSVLGLEQAGQGGYDLNDLSPSMVVARSYL